VPEPKAGEVLIRITGAGINRADTCSAWGAIDAARRQRIPASNAPATSWAGRRHRHHAIQLAKASGVKVLATAGSEEKCQRAAISARRSDQLQDEDFVKIARSSRRPRGRPMASTWSARLHPAELDLLAREGRLCLSADGRTKIEADFGMIQRKHLTVTGSTLRGRSIRDKAKIVSALKERSGRSGARQAAHLHLQDFPLAEASKATR